MKKVFAMLLLLMSLAFAASENITVNTVDMTPTTNITKGTQSMICWVNATSTANTTMKFWYEIQSSGVKFNDGYGYNLPNDTRFDIITEAMAKINLSDASQVMKGDNITCNVTVQSPEGIDSTDTFFSDNYTVENFNTTLDTSISFINSSVHKVNITAKFFDWDNDFDTTWTVVENGTCDFVIASAVNNINTVRFNCTIDTGKRMGVTIWQNDTSGANVSTLGYVMDTVTCPGISGEFSTPGEIYNMSESCYSDSGASEYAFLITAPNVTLNCNGSSIIGDNSSGITGIYTNASNTTIKNCIITDFEYGIYANSSSNSLFQNNTIGPTLLSGIYLATSDYVNITGGEIKDANTGTPGGTTYEAGIALDVSKYGTISNVYMHNDRQGAVWIMAQSDGTNVLNNNIDQNCGFIRQIICQESEDIEIVGNNVTNGTGNGIEIFDCDYSNISNNQINDNVNLGVYVQDTNFTYFVNNNILRSGNDGFQLVNSEYNTIDGLNVTSGANQAIYVSGGSDNDFYNVVATGGSAAAILISQTLYVDFEDVVASSSDGHGIWVYNSSEADLYNLTITSNNESAVYLQISDNNSIVYSSIVANTSVGVYLLSSIGNVIAMSQITGNDSVYGALLYDNESNDNFLFVSNVSGGSADYAVNLWGSETNLFVANVFSSAGTLVALDTSSINNSFCLNNFTTAGVTRFVFDEAGGNFYSCGLPGSTEGNIWGDIMNGTVQIYGSVNSSFFTTLYIGSSGTGYPYSNSTSSMVIGNVVDTAPLTDQYGVPTPTPSAATTAILGVIAVVVALVLIVIILQMDVTIENLVLLLVIAIIAIQIIIPYLLNA